MKSIFANRQVSYVATGLGLAALLLVAYMLFQFIYLSVEQVNNSLNQAGHVAEQFILKGTH